MVNPLFSMMKDLKGGTMMTDKEFYSTIDSWDELYENDMIPDELDAWGDDGVLFNTDDFDEDYYSVAIEELDDGSE